MGLKDRIDVRDGAVNAVPEVGAGEHLFKVNEGTQIYSYDNQQGETRKSILLKFTVADMADKDNGAVFSQFIYVDGNKIVSQEGLFISVLWGAGILDAFDKRFPAATSPGDLFKPGTVEQVTDLANALLTDRYIRLEVRKGGRENKPFIYKVVEIPDQAATSSAPVALEELEVA